MEISEYLKYRTKKVLGADIIDILQIIDIQPIHYVLLFGENSKELPWFQKFILRNEYLLDNPYDYKREETKILFERCYDDGNKYFQFAICCQNEQDIFDFLLDYERFKFEETTLEYFEDENLPKDQYIDQFIQFMFLKTFHAKIGKYPTYYSLVGFYSTEVLFKHGFSEVKDIGKFHHFLNYKEMWINKVEDIKSVNGVAICRIPEFLSKNMEDVSMTMAFKDQQEILNMIMDYEKYMFIYEKEKTGICIDANNDENRKE